MNTTTTAPTKSDLLQGIDNELKSMRSFDFDVTNSLMEKYEPLTRPVFSGLKTYTYKY